MQEIMQFVSRHPVLSIAWIGLLAAVLFTTFKSLTSKIKVITRGEATRLINKEDAVVVDLRQRDDFRKGHIAGAINLLPAEIKANNVGELETQSPAHYRCGCDRYAGAGICQRALQSGLRKRNGTERRDFRLERGKSSFGSR